MKARKAMALMMASAMAVSMMACGSDGGTATKAADEGRFQSYILALKAPF